MNEPRRSLHSFLTSSPYSPTSRKNHYSSTNSNYGSWIHTSKSDNSINPTEIKTRVCKSSSRPTYPYPGMDSSWQSGKLCSSVLAEDWDIYKPFRLKPFVPSVDIKKIADEYNKEQNRQAELERVTRENAKAEAQERSKRQKQLDDQRQMLDQMTDKLDSIPGSSAVTPMTKQDIDAMMRNFDTLSTNHTTLKGSHSCDGVYTSSYKGGAGEIRIDNYNEIHNNMLYGSGDINSQMKYISQDEERNNNQNYIINAKPNSDINLAERDGDKIAKNNIQNDAKLQFNSNATPSDSPKAVWKAPSDGVLDIKQNSCSNNASQLLSPKLDKSVTSSSNKAFLSDYRLPLINVNDVNNVNTNSKSANKLKAHTIITSDNSGDFPRQTSPGAPQAVTPNIQLPPKISAMGDVITANLGAKSNEKDNFNTCTGKESSDKLQDNNKQRLHFPPNISPNNRSATSTYSFSTYQNSSNIKHPSTTGKPNSKVWKDKNSYTVKGEPISQRTQFSNTNLSRNDLSKSIGAAQTAQSNRNEASTLHTSNVPFINVRQSSPSHSAKKQTISDHFYSRPGPPPKGNAISLSNPYAGAVVNCVRQIESKSTSSLLNNSSNSQQQANFSPGSQMSQAQLYDRIGSNNYPQFSADYNTYQNYGRGYQTAVSQSNNASGSSNNDKSNSYTNWNLSNDKYQFNASAIVSKYEQDFNETMNAYKDMVYGKTGYRSTTGFNNNSYPRHNQTNNTTSNSTDIYPMHNAAAASSSSLDSQPKRSILKKAKPMNTPVISAGPAHNKPSIKSSFTTGNLSGRIGGMNGSTASPKIGSINRFSVKNHASRTSPNRVSPNVTDMSGSQKHVKFNC